MQFSYQTLLGLTDGYSASLNFVEPVKTRVGATVESAEITDANVTEDKLASSLTFDDGYPIKTISTKKGETGENKGNDLRFDDTKDAEEFFIHAQKHMNLIVENN
ncbi:MAG: hypothetical protein GY749_32985 [Desulfobacteraceae bacterium]|nr:hypothetical protein [Desulfobacteraceae bacterium]